MRLTLIKPILCLFVIFISYSAQAIEINNLYQVRVDVQGQSKSEKEEALKEAMQQVLVKVSGKVATLQAPEIQSQVSSPNQYIKTYSYDKTKDARGLLLKVDFAKDKIDTLLIEHKQFLWGASRPLLLVWLADSSTRNKRIVSLEDEIIKPYFIRAMDERGLPIQWPYVDAFDTSELSFNELWRFKNSAISSASKRYNADTILAGRLQKQGFSWSFSGYLIQPEYSILINEESETKFGLSRKISAIIAEKLAEQYSIKIQINADKNRKEIKVVSVKDFNTYHSLIGYLNNKTGINGVTPVKIQNTTLTLELDLSTSWLKVESSLRLDKKLTPDALHLDAWRWYQ